MKLAFLSTPFDSGNLANPYSTGSYIVRNLQKHGVEFELIGPFNDYAKYYFYAKQLILKKLTGKVHLYSREINFIKRLNNKFDEELKVKNVDAILSFGSLPFVFLKSRLPKIFWGDAVFIGLQDYYLDYKNLSPNSIKNGHLMEQKAFDNTDMLFFASEWAKQNALQHYKVQENKITVIPFGANIDFEPQEEEVLNYIQNRNTDIINLIYIGYDWKRKGGDIALDVIASLKRQGNNPLLTIIGYEPDIPDELKNNVNVLGRIDKYNPLEKNIFYENLSKSHFLLFPTRAEAFGIVYCEANAFGVPCLGTKTAAGEEIIREGINGHTFHLQDSADEYSKIILRYMENYSQYINLAKSSYNEYQTRLNWQTNTKIIYDKINDLLA